MTRVFLSTPCNWCWSKPNPWVDAVAGPHWRHTQCGSAKCQDVQKAPKQIAFREFHLSSWKSWLVSFFDPGGLERALRAARGPKGQRNEAGFAGNKVEFSDVSIRGAQDECSWIGSIAKFFRRPARKFLANLRTFS